MSRRDRHGLDRIGQLLLVVLLTAGPALTAAHHHPDVNDGTEACALCRTPADPQPAIVLDPVTIDHPKIGVSRYTLVAAARPSHADRSEPLVRGPPHTS